MPKRIGDLSVIVRFERSFSLPLRRLFGLDDLEDCRPFEHDASRNDGGSIMCCSHFDVSSSPLGAKSTSSPTKILKIVPKKAAIQAAVVAVTVGAVMMDSKFISRRIARRFES